MFSKISSNENYNFRLLRQIFVVRVWSLEILLCIFQETLIILSADFTRTPTLLEYFMFSVCTVINRNFFIHQIVHEFLLISKIHRSTGNDPNQTCSDRHWRYRRIFGVVLKLPHNRVSHLSTTRFLSTAPYSTVDRSQQK